jgi:hypothetical protein
LIPFVSAQFEGISYDIFRAFLGEIPSPCVDITDPLCWKCLLFVKVVPLTFLSGFGFVVTCIFIYNIMYPGKKLEWEKIKPYKYPIATIAILIGILVMNWMSPQKFINMFGKIYDLWFWIKWGIIISLLTLIWYGERSPLIRGISILVVVVTIWVLFKGYGAVLTAITLSIVIVTVMLWVRIFALTESTAVRLILILLSVIAIGLAIFYTFPYIQQLGEIIKEIHPIFRERREMISEILQQCF